MKIIKVNYSISEETKKMLDTYRKTNKVNMSNSMDKILKFNKEGLGEYINLISKFQQKEEWNSKTDNFVCTTIKDEVCNFDLIMGHYVDKKDTKVAAIDSMLEKAKESDNPKSTTDILSDDIEKLRKQVNDLSALYFQTKNRIDEIEKK
jgi:hypothetical protein